MTEIKSVNAPAIGQKGINRLLSMTRETRMTTEATAFNAGYEQAKRDFRDAIRQEVGVPSNQAQEAEHLRVSPEETSARNNMTPQKRWWQV